MQEVTETAIAMRETDRGLYDVIRSRRSVSKMRAEAPPPEMIQRLIEAAVWAPNHYQIEPWGFYVLTGDARARFGEALADGILRDATDPEDPHVTAKVTKWRRAPLRAPYVIAVTAQEDPDRVKHKDNYAAAAAAVQNMLLAAEHEGLAAIWRTGAIVDHPSAKLFLGIPPEREIVGFVYIGYPDMEPASATRLPLAARVTWLD